MTSLWKAEEIWLGCYAFLCADINFKGGLFHQHPGIIFKFLDILKAESIANSTDAQIRTKKKNLNKP
jgi:hypothetical protein